MTQRTLVLVFAAALGGCNYSYRNPAQELGAGEVAGTARTAGHAAAGVAVTVKGSALDQAARPTGRFSLLPLQPAAYTVILRDGRARALTRELTVSFGGDGQAEGLWLGELDLPQAVGLSGSVLTPGTESADGVAVDEVTGMAVPLRGTFLLDGQSVGHHRIWAATRNAAGAQWVGGPVEVELPAPAAGGVLELAPIALVQEGGTGVLTFRIGAAALTSGDAAASAPHLLDALGGEVALPSPDTGGRYSVDLSPGIYQLRVRAPAAVLAPPPATVVVGAGQVFDAGTLLLLYPGAVDAAQSSCVSAADCGPSGACVGHLCTGYTPAAPAPANLPFCPPLPECSTSSTTTCALPGWPDEAITGTCVPYPDSPYAQGACLRCGAACTTDGTTVLHAPDCP